MTCQRFSHRCVLLPSFEFSQKHRRTLYKPEHFYPAHNIACQVNKGKLFKVPPGFMWRSSKFLWGKIGSYYYYHSIWHLENCFPTSKWTVTEAEKHSESTTLGSETDFVFTKIERSSRNQMKYSERLPTMEEWLRRIMELTEMTKLTSLIVCMYVYICWCLEPLYGQFLDYYYFLLTCLYYFYK